jgi:hypothetical protein
VFDIASQPGDLFLVVKLEKVLQEIELADLIAILDQVKIMSRSRMILFRQNTGTSWGFDSESYGLKVKKTSKY